MSEDYEDRRKNDNVRFLIVEDHINPIRERLIGVEKAIEYEQKMNTERFNNVDDRMGRAEDKLDTLTDKVDENHDLVKKIWNSMWGGGCVVIVIWAIVTFAIPMFIIGG